MTIRVRDPRRANSHGDSPQVARVDLIAGKITGPMDDRSIDRNPTTKVVARFTARDWTQDGEFLTMTHTFSSTEGPFYFRVRGTNSAEQLEPALDPRGENPWSDLWFYSNPVFVEISDQFARLQIIGVRVELISHH